MNNTSHDAPPAYNNVGDFDRSDRDYKPVSRDWEDALVQGHLKDVAFFLDNGASIDDPIEHNPSIGKFPPICVASYNSHPKVVSLLLKRGAYVDATDKYYNRGLHFACQISNEEIVRILLEAGSSPKEPNENGVTPLMIASKQNNLEIATMICKKAVSREYVNLTNDNGKSAYQLAEDKEVKDLLERYGAETGKVTIGKLANIFGGGLGSSMGAALDSGKPIYAPNRKASRS